MSEKKTDNTNKSMRFHKFYTYVYLPLSAVIALIIALGRFYHLRTLSLDTFKGWIELVHDMYPLVCSVLAIISLPFLIGKTGFGRRIVLFSETFKSLLCLVLIAAYLSFGNILPAFIYTLLVFAMALVYGYYRMREWEFDPVEKKAPISQAAVICPEPPLKKEEPVEEIKKEEKAEEVVEEKEPVEVEIKNEEAEEKEITIEETEIDSDSSDTIKITSIVPATFTKGCPLLIEDISIKTEKEHSILSITVRNISNKTFSSSTWILDDIREFTSEKTINPLSTTVIRAKINVPTDRASIMLSSISEKDGNVLDMRGKTRLSLPSKYDVSSLSKDDRFPFFLEEYKKREGVEAKYIYTENETSSSWLCPQCGIPVLSEIDRCPLCGLDKDKAEKFNASSITLQFEKAKENREE